MRRLLTKITFISAILLTSTSLLAEPQMAKKYEYTSSQQSFAKSAKLVSILYGLNWFGYYLSQPDEFREEGSFTKYRDNLGELHFDKDSPFWNLMIHPFTGSQLFLFYRSQGYERTNAFFMTLIQSTLFEFTVEIYTEPASVQDLYQTPVLGSVLGFALEHASLKLLNSNTTWGTVLGHIINPWTLFNFSGIKTTMVPAMEGNKPVGLTMMVEY